MATKYREILNRIDVVTGEGQGNFIRRRKNDDAASNKIRHNAGGSGKCATCRFCTIPPRSKWSAKIGLCHGRGTGTPIVVALSSTCRFRDPSRPNKMRFERRPQGFRERQAKDVSWQDIMEKDEILRDLIAERKFIEENY